MATPYSDVIEMFLRRVEKEKSFINYRGLDDNACLEIVEKRASGYLDEAIALLMLKCCPSINFFNRDSELKQFNFDITDQEKYLISSLMFQCHLNRDIAFLKTKSVNYTPEMLKVFDPNGDRRSFLDMYKTVCSENDELLSSYKDTNRLEGTYKTINFSQYDESE